MRRITIAVLLLLMLLSLSACTVQDPFDAGTPLSADEVRSLKESLTENNTPPAEPEPEPEPLPEPSVGEGTVYWLESGSVYHVSADCRYLKNKTNVKTGTVEDANAASKARACSSCAGK
ncbi:MAG: hypothetical protein IJW51_00555 [Clostridia bacterium]|nr:hypothetical protein [Clostridia bacterium]